MRILHIIPSLAMRDGGPAKAALETCRELVRSGEIVEIFTTNADGSGCLDVPLGRAVEIDGVKVTYFPVIGSHYYKLSLAMAIALRVSIPEFDIVHINSLYQFPSTIAAHYCRKYRVPFVLRPHGTLDPFLYYRHSLRKRTYEFLFEDRNLSTAAAVNFTADEEMRLAKSLGLRFRGVVVPLGVSLDRAEASKVKSNMAELWPETAGKRILLFLSRINFKKGLDILVRAFGDVARERDDLHLLLAGPDDDDYGRQVKRWLAEEKVLKKATFCGMLAGNEKDTVLAESELFVLPSYTENFGLAVVEAMAAGLPVVISNKVNICREVSAGGAGIVVSTNVSDLSEALTTLLADPEAGREMGRNGKRVASDFSWRATAMKLTELYRKILASAPLE